MGRVDDKVALITGIARGQGRSHAVRLAREGADILGLDVAGPIGTPHYPPSSEGDLEETISLVEATGRRIIARKGDVRHQKAIDDLVADGLDEFGHIDIVCANAGIVTLGRTWELSDAQWDEMLAINLTGVWRTLKAATPPMIEAGRGGSMILTSSMAGVMGMPTLSHYAAAKHGVMGLMRSLANELAEYFIRVNAILPTNVATPMILNEGTYANFRPDLDNPTQEDAKVAFASYNMLPIPWIEPEDVSHAVLWLASDEAKFVTGAAIPIDAGTTAKFPG
jgi:SDR family mycofactocin-dependent oxidoreductase